MNFEEKISKLVTELHNHYGDEVFSSGFLLGACIEMFKHLPNSEKIIMEMIVDAALSDINIAPK